MKSIYFIQLGISGPIKIGISSNPKKRLKTMQVACYDWLTLLAVWIPQGEVEYFEKEIHKRFDDLNLRGEWFEPKESLLKFIDTIKKQENTRVANSQILFND